MAYKRIIPCLDVKDSKVVKGINFEGLKSIADPIRLKIIYLLQDEELCVCELLDALNKTQPTISYHLNLLKKSGIIRGRKEGKWTHYQLTNPRIVEDLNNIFQK